MRTINTQQPAFATRMAMGIASIFLLGAALFQTSQAQPYSSIMTEKQQFRRASVIELENFLGVYQLPDKVGFVIFALEDNSFLATQLWDNKKYQLIQIDETTFETKEEGHTVAFRKDASGEYNEAMLLGRIVATRVAFDPSVIQQLSVEQLKSLQGTYVFADDSNFEIEIKPSATGLTLKQLWDNKEIYFSARSETFFLNEDNTFPLTFLLEGAQAIQVTCFANDIWKKR